MRHADYLLDQWAELTVRKGNSLGYSSTTTLGMLQKGDLRFDLNYYSKIPTDIDDPGLWAFNIVERVLSRLGTKYRVVAGLEFGVLRLKGTRTQKERATATGLNCSTYTHWLMRLRKEIESEVKPPHDGGSVEGSRIA